MSTRLSEDSHTIEPKDGGFAVYSHGTYGEHSVLAGQPGRAYKGCYGSAKEAKDLYPKAEVLDGSSKGRVAHTAVASRPEPWFDPADAGESW